MPLRPTWRAFVLSLATGSLYQLYWLVVVGRELGWLGARMRATPVLTMVLVSAAQLAVLTVAALGESTSTAWTIALSALLVGGWAMFGFGRAVVRLQADAGVERRASPLITSILFAVGCGVGATGVLPQGDLDMATRIIGAVTTGLVLPFWLLYLQHHINRALQQLGPVSEDEELFGAASNGNEAMQDAMRRRVAEWHRRRARETERELVPWATYGLAALCTAVFAWQVISFGVDLSLREMRSSGASSIDLVNGGDWWRLLTQHVVHFTVDHWAFNMFALLMTGWVVERTIGHGRTLAAMGAAVAGSTALTWFLAPYLYGPIADEVIAGGESGIGFGMIGALLAIDRHGHTQTGRFAWWLTGIGAVGSLAPNVGVLAHAGGFAGGFLAVWLLHRVSWELPEIDVRDDTFELPAATAALGTGAQAPAVIAGAAPITGEPVRQVSASVVAPPPVVPPPATPPMVVAPPPLPPVDRRFG